MKHTLHAVRFGAIRPGRQGSTGFTLVELMVAMTLGLLVAAAGVAALIIGRQGFTTVDSATQLRETARYAASAIDQAAIEVGFQNAAYGMFNTSAPTLRGYDNSLVFPAFASLPSGLAHDTRTSTNCGAATGTACLNGSDVLVVNFWGASRNGNPDGTMVNCGGFPEPEGAGPLPGGYSILHVATKSTGEINAEPALACTYRDTGGAWHTVPIVQGVESFQVMYGVYGITAGACAASPANPSTPSAATPIQTHVETYLTAKQLDGPSGYCANNWTYVRNLRIGLLVRGPLHSAQSNVASPPWNLMAAPGETPFFSTAPKLTTAADGRLRQQLVFTIHIRNSL